MEENVYECNRSGASSPQDPLAPLSDYGPDSSCSSWGSGDSPSSSPVPFRNCNNSPVSINDFCFDVSSNSGITDDWKARYNKLQLEMSRYQDQSFKTRELLHVKLSELEQRVFEAESRAEEAEDKVRLMEERLQASEWGSGSGPPSIETSTTSIVTNENDTAITKLATQVEEQRQLRLQDAKLVEAKAARIKEWVTNKLRELEAQNQHLREQNHKCNQQLELLRRHMAQLNAGRLAESVTSATDSLSRPTSLHRGNSAGSTQSLTDREPVYAQVDRQTKSRHASSGEVLMHRRNLSVCTPPVSVASDASSTITNNASQLTSDLQKAVHSLALLPVHIRPKPTCTDADVSHDYAEIYTPSGEKIGTWDNEDKPPTLPLHRFPSWESRIYQLADFYQIDDTTNFTNSFPSQSDSISKVHFSVSHYSSGYCDISCPVYASVKGRASQIRSSPFSGDSSDDSSDGEGDHLLHSHLPVGTRTTNSSTDNTDTSISSSSPGKSQSQKTGSSLSPLKCSASLSPSKNTSFESGISDDYAIPPDAMSCSGDSTDWSSLITKAHLCNDSPSHNCSKANIELCFEKYGHLNKLGGKLKTWRRRWFHLNSAGKLRYWKTQNDVNKKPRGEILIDDLCKITRADGAATFEILINKKSYYLTADSVQAMEDWLKVLQNVQRRSATKILLSKENFKPTLQGWLTKVRNGHAKKCWCVLIGKTFLYFKSSSDNNPAGQINMREARVEQVEHVSDSDSDDRETDTSQQLTIGIFPSSQPPSYLLMPSKQEKDSWLYHLTIVSGANPHAGTQYEQHIQKLMETEGDSNSVLWKHPLLLHSKESLTTTLTTLSSDNLQAEAVKLFKCCQLFMSVAVESAGIDYHVVLAQNALQKCLDNWQLQTELVCILIKQTSPHVAQKTGVQVLSKLRHRQLLLCASQSLFACDTAGSPTVANMPPMPTALNTADHCKANPPMFVFLQGWQLLALTVSLFVPKDNKILWFLKCHLRRSSDAKTECGKYASYCERALERTIQNGNREVKPSRMEVLSILLKNPYHHSLPHSIPVHLLNGTYQVTGFDGSTTIEEFLSTLNQEIGCRDSVHSGFTLFSDDPIEKNLEHYVEPQTKLCDVISKWETALREKGSGKFENTKVIQLVYKNRLYFRNSAKKETDRERLLLCYQTNQQIMNDRFPVTEDLALELASLMAQIDYGDFSSERGRGSGGTKELLVLQAFDRFYPFRYRDGLDTHQFKKLQGKLQEKWLHLAGRSPLECVRIYLTCTRKWPYFGSALYLVKWKKEIYLEKEIEDGPFEVVWLAASDNSISLLEASGMQTIVSYSYSQVITFGGCQTDFMLVISTNGGQHSKKLLFSLYKPKILELTLVIADYMNALGHNSTPVCGTLTNNIQPDILKATPDHQLHRTGSKKYHFDS